MCRRCSTPSLAVPCKGHKCVYRKRKSAILEVVAVDNNMTEAGAAGAIVAFKELEHREICTRQNATEINGTIPEVVAADMAEVVEAVPCKKPELRENIGTEQNETEPNEAVQNEILRALKHICATVTLIHENIVTMNRNIVLQQHQSRATA